MLSGSNRWNEKSKTKPKALLSGYEFCTICYPIAVQHIGSQKSSMPPPEHQPNKGTYVKHA
jgi:hypothetical protein